MELNEISAFLKKPVDNLLGSASKELKQLFKNRLLEYQVEEYKRNYYSKTLLHRSEPKALNTFYQPLFIRVDDTEHYNSDRISTKSAPKLFEKHNYLTIIGSAGSGKSTIIKYLYTNCFDENYKIPIKLELRYLNEYNGTLNQYIFDEIFHFQKLGFSGTIIDRMLSSDGFVFFFDGYDEVNSTIRSRTIKELDSFVQKYPKNKYVVTSRPYTSIDLLPLFVNYYVCDLNENEIAAFVRKQIPKNEEELANKIIEAIGKVENRSYDSFLSNPLLLSMFILTFQSYSEIPKRRSEFYDQVFDTLFSIHDSISKLAYVREKQCGLSKDQFEEVLQLFSFLSFFEEKFIFPPNYLTDKLNIIKSKKKTLNFDNEKIIDDLQVAIGILNKEGIDYTFPHRSLQEYFAALYISKLGKENKERLYLKLKKDIEQFYRGLLRRDHFFSLLTEMDYNDLSINVAIPLVTSILETVKTSPKITDEIAYVCYGRLLLTFIILLRTREFHSEIHNQVVDDEVRFVFYSSETKNNLESDFFIPQDKIEGTDIFDRLNFPLMKEKIQFFKENGDRIISAFIENINDREKSDEEIIDLIG